MSEFARGARVRPKPERELRTVDAALVMCNLAERDGLLSEEQFLGYMQAAWRAYQACKRPSQNGEVKP